MEWRSNKLEPDQAKVDSTFDWVRIRRVEGREWWLWGYAVTVTLVLTLGIVALTFPGLHLPTDELHALSLKEWVRGLAALVLLFDIYTVYQHLQLQRIRRRLAEREQLFHLITENAADMIAVVDRHGNRVYNSPAYERVLGYCTDELASTSSIEQIHPDDRARVLEAAQKAHLTGRGERLEYRVRHKNGGWRVLESTASAIRGENAETQGLVIVNRDVTERKRAEALLEHRAFYDDLTNLPNRALFLDRLQRATAVSLRHSGFRFAVLFIDLDEFKVFNDSLGHSAGDDLLIQIATRLTACLRNSDTISRPGGDEFAVLADDLHDPSDAIRLSDRIQQRLAVPFNIGNQEIVISASIGVVFSGCTMADASDVLRDAEIAMYRAKRAGKARCEVFDSAMQVEAVKRLQLETDLRKGLELDEFRVYYQPLVSLQSGEIVGFEALSRWHRPYGMVMPGKFIKVADEIGLTLAINRQLLREACEQACRWQAVISGNFPFSISANITARQFAQSDLAIQTGEILQQTGIDPGHVHLEITENIAMADAQRSALVLSELRALGVRLSIDDFGTGYSSLSRLREFPVDILKIDRAFIAAMDQDDDSREIVKVIITLAHSLGLQVIAEGVERREQLEILKCLKCELGQGYLFSEPADAASTEELLTTQLPRSAKRAQAGL